MLSLWIFNRTRESSFGDFVVLAFLVVQALDGALTYVGLATIGHVVEGNPLVAGLMASFGLGIGLHLFGTHRLVALLTALYVAVAIVPWLAVLAIMS